jgi:hypothetical protein
MTSLQCVIKCSFHSNIYKVHHTANTIRGTPMKLCHLRTELGLLLHVPQTCLLHLIQKVMPLFQHVSEGNPVHANHISCCYLTKSVSLSYKFKEIFQWYSQFYEEYLRLLALKCTVLFLTCVPENVKRTHFFKTCIFKMFCIMPELFA